jgi:hypothetical protein
MSQVSEVTVTRHGIFDAQVCVPKDWTDEQVLAWGNEQLHHPYSIRKVHENGDAERVTCSVDCEKVHIVLDY